MDQTFQAPRNGLDWRQRVVQFVPDDADEALPRLPLLLAKRLADIGHDEQLVRDAALPEVRSSNFPTSGVSGKRDVVNPRLGTERRYEPELIGGPARRFVRQQMLDEIARTRDVPT